MTYMGMDMFGAVKSLGATGSWGDKGSHNTGKKGEE